MPDGDPVMFQISARLEELSTRVDGLMTLIIEGRRTQWGVIAAFAGILLTLASALGGLVIELGNSTLVPLKERLIEIQGQVSRVQDDMAPKGEVNKRIDQLYNRLEQLHINQGKR
jgi:hypothetical protein